MNATIGCVRAATEIIGDKWTPQLLRCLNNEKSLRFCKLQDSVGNINPRTLSARLIMLEDHGVIEKLSCKDSARCEYRLTRKGKDLLPILRDMEQWGQRYYRGDSHIA